MTASTGVWGPLERVRSVAFLAAGVAFLAITINAGFRWLANTGMDLSPLVHMGFLLLVYVGLLGLSPRLVERAPRLGRVAQVLVLALGLEIVLTFAVYALSGPIPRSPLALIVVTAMIGAALAPTVFGVASLRTGAFSRAVGGFLLLAAFGLYLGIAETILFGDIGGPEWASIVVNGTFGLSWIAVGFLLRTDSKPTEQAESTETVA